MALALARDRIERDRADGSVQVALLALCTSQWKYIPPLPTLLKELARYRHTCVPSWPSLARL